MALTVATGQRESTPPFLLAEFFEAGRNELPDPRFTAGFLTTSDVVVSAAMPDVGIERNLTIEGPSSLRVGFVSSSVVGPSAFVRWTVPVRAGQLWSAAVDAAHSSAGVRAGLSLEALDGVGGVIDSVEALGDWGAADRVQLYIEGAEMPLTTVALRLGLRAHSDAVGVSGIAVFDTPQLNEGVEALQLVEGSSGGAHWEDVPLLSASVRAGESVSMARVLSWVPRYYYSDPQ